jgi:FAD/FMN-containing dehydrogenase
MGKSTGKGSLSLWTHYLNTSQIVENYSSDYYTGPAVKVGAGVIAGFLYKTVSDAGYRVVGGTCASVGIAGGYSAGGGHSIINGLYGMAADNVLEWEVVTAQGEHIIATPDNQYSDLYWAMSGGGGGVWGVVISMTSRIHPDGEIGGASLTYNASNVDADVFWSAIEAWYAYLPSYTDGLNGGNTVEFEITATSFNAISFTIPGASKSNIDSLLDPYLKQLQELGIEYSYSSHTSPNFYNHYNADLGPLPYGPWPGDILFSNRLFPRAVSENTTTNSVLVETIRNMTTYQDGYFWLGCMAARVNSSTGHPDNAVLPAFRDVLGICTTIGYWNWTIPLSDMLERKAYLVDEIVPAYEAVTPGSGSYLNEVDSWYEGNWKQEFYGINYDRLLQIKDKYDPDHFFYAYTGIGSDYWYPDASGRLCES